MRDVRTITDVKFYDVLDDELLHIPDPEFTGEEGKQIVLPDGANIATATYMMLTFEDGTCERIEIEPGSPD
jgi:hypothetical protein